MPEGDTVYQTARRLDRALGGRVLTETDFRVPAFATVDLSGQRMEEVVSRGKHLLMHVGDHTIHSHLKMEGSWEVYPPDGRWRHPGAKGARGTIPPLPLLSDRRYYPCDRRRMARARSSAVRGWKLAGPPGQAGYCHYHGQCPKRREACDSRTGHAPPVPRLTFWLR